MASAAPLPTSGTEDDVWTLALQLRSALDVGFTCGGLVGSSPERPCDDVSGSDAPLSQSRRDAPDLLNRPADQDATRRALRVVFGGAMVLARCLTAAIIAKASITSETCRCQPCQERVSL